MGNTNSSRVAGEFGEVIYSCSFKKWMRRGRYLCGYDDLTDYTTSRYEHIQDRAMEDCFEGRCFSHSFEDATKVRIMDRLQQNVSAVINLPDVPLGYCEADTNIIGYHDGLAVLCVFFKQNPKRHIFYLLDLDDQNCVGQFLIDDSYKSLVPPKPPSRFECYISPEGKTILLRPGFYQSIWLDRNRHTKIGFERLHLYEQYSRIDAAGLGIAIELLPWPLSYCALTFNAHLGDNAIIYILKDCLIFYSLEKSEPFREEGPFDVPAAMEQIRSSPSGDYLAIRCVNLQTGSWRNLRQVPEPNINILMIFHFFTLQMVLKIDVSGAYFPNLESVNFQVFPKFAISESSVAIMRNRFPKPKIYVYRLPPVFRLNLQHLCRCVILQLVSFKKCERLPLPRKLIKFLQLGHKV